MLPNNTIVEMRQFFDSQHLASRQAFEVSLAIRRDRLLRLQRLIDEHEADLAAAVQSDFGVRSAQLTQVADMLLLRSMLAQTLKSLPRWMKPEKVATPVHLLPSRAYVMRQPLGVVGIVATWNYPVQLALAPALTALAAGNRRAAVWPGLRRRVIPPAWH
jgi:coniferyl-aldehyde dehydrogenase